MKTMLVVALGLVLPALALAGPPRYDGLVLSDAKDGAPKSVFPATTPKIFLKAKLVDMPTGTKLTSDWIAVKTKVAPANYKLDSVVLTVGALTNRADFSFTKPTAGWPLGDYRVDLFIDGKAATSVAFKVR